jgi:hypothetical protein
MYLVHELLARTLVAYVDAAAAVVTGVKLARVDGEVQGVLTGFGGWGGAQTSSPKIRFSSAPH